MIWTKAYCKIIANHSHHLNCQAYCEQFLYHPSDVTLSSSLNLSRLDTNLLIEGSLEVKLPTIWTNEKQRWEESEKRREEERKSQKKEDPGARKGRKAAQHCVFPMICGSGGSKSRLAKAAGADPAGQMRDEKLHAVVARSTFASEKARSTSRSEHFLKLRCQKNARRCGAEHS